MSLDFGRCLPYDTTAHHVPMVTYYYTSRVYFFVLEKQSRSIVVKNSWYIDSGPESCIAAAHETSLFWLWGENCNTKCYLLIFIRDFVQERQSIE